jgi:hypothetical protein
MTASTNADIALLDILDPAFRVDSPEVRAASDASWWARTTMGLAVLRYQECLLPKPSIPRPSAGSSP